MKTSDGINVYDFQNGVDKSELELAIFIAGIVILLSAISATESLVQGRFELMAVFGFLIGLSGSIFVNLMNKWKGKK